MLRFAPTLTLAVFLLPIAAGLIGTLLPAFGYLPALGGTSFNLAPWRDLIAYPGFASALRLTLTAGFAATTLSFVLAVALCACLYGSPLFARLQSLLAPVLATPHSALALGWAFLIAPSGWLSRWLSPEITGWAQPPDIATVNDAGGVALTLGLVLKETPYLLLMMVAALNQVPAARHLAITRSLGYTQATAWIKVILPQIYPQLRLPLYAVLAFSLSVVDVALILGPGNPPTLAVLATRWFFDADVRLYFPAAAAAMLQLLLIVTTIGCWRVGELAVVALGQCWIARGKRGCGDKMMKAQALIALSLLAGSLLSLLGMALWSFAARWRFPDALPTEWTLATWARHAGVLAWPGQMTLAVGLTATAFALLLTLGCLEHEQRHGVRGGSGALWLLYAPLLVPQIAFLFGAQVLLIRLGLDGTFAAVVWAHLLFVLPYLFLSLADPWRVFDPRYARTAASLGASANAVFWRVKLPMLLQPILIACAVGFAVSVGQYLPTLFAGNGRITTLTTEAVTLAGGNDRRVLGVYVFLQALLPFALYTFALVLPALVYRQRQDMRGAR